MHTHKKSIIFTIVALSIRQHSSGLGHGAHRVVPEARFEVQPKLCHSGQFSLCKPT
jgi:hypothetical protein